MSVKKRKIEDLIQDYLLDEGLLREKLPDPQSNLDFGFIFSYPSGPKSEKMSVFKPKNKNYIVIAIRTQLSKAQIKTLNSLKDDGNIKFFMDLRKFFLIKEVFFRMDVKNFMYEISDQLYFDNIDKISRDSFFKIIRKIFYCFFYSNIILGEYCYGKELISKKADFDFSLYS